VYLLFIFRFFVLMATHAASTARATARARGLSFLFVQDTLDYYKNEYCGNY